MKRPLLTIITCKIVLSQLEKIGGGKITLGDDILVRFMDQTNAY